MKYLLTIYADERGWDDATPEQAKAMVDAYNAFTEEVRDAGIFVAGEGIQPSPTAVSVRVRDGKVSTVDGPFAETKEQLGGFYLLECKDRDEAVSLAAKVPGAAHGTVEVRPVIDYEAVG